MDINSIRHRRCQFCCRFLINSLILPSSSQVCPICGLSIASLQKHIENIHDQVKNYICDLCGYGAYTRSTFENHVLSHFPGRVKCLHCDFGTTTEKLLQQHVTNRHEVHKRNVTMLPCLECDQTFMSVYGLNGHVLRKHRMVRNYECAACGKLFFSANELKFVIASNNFPNQSSKFISTFSAHRKHQHEEKSAVCEICGGAYGSEKLLRSHMISHRERKFTCDLCGNQYATQRRADRHMKW